ncbi:MAG: Fe-Mn family superoxide dismutase [bacterium]
MEKFKELKFNLPAQTGIPELKGISAKNIEEHLKLYAGYVKNTNYILGKIEELRKDADNAYLLTELQRRFAFEFGGMRNHEYYFSSLSGGPTTLPENSELKKAIVKDFGSLEKWLTDFKGLAMTKGIGWAMLSCDKKTGQLLNHWVDEQHIGHLVSTSPVLALDMWEHAYVYDYPTSEKKKYIYAFFENLNWSVLEKNFLEA